MSASVITGPPRWARRRIKKQRRWAGVALLCAPLLWSLGLDLWRRWSHIASFDTEHRLGYAASFAACGVFWGVLLYSASRRRGFVSQLSAGLFVTLYTLSVGVQTAFHAFYNIYLSHDCQIYSRSVLWSLLGFLPFEAMVLWRLIGTLLLAVAMVSLARKWSRPRKTPRRLVPWLIPLLCYGMYRMPASYRSWQSSAPESIYFQGLVSLYKERTHETADAPELRVQRRHPEDVPAMTPAPARPRNVLLILQESQRYDVTCNGYDPKGECATPFSNQAVPDRYALDQMRAGAATTAISISNLWSGVSPVSSYETLLSVPLLWDYADAAGINGAYWTSQNVMFGSMRLYVQDFPVTHRAYGTNLDREAHYDAGANDSLLTDRIIEDWATLEEPFFAVAHYSNVHFPYVYDPERAPFQPAEFTKEAGKNEHFLNYYRNVVYLSDIAVGRLLDHVRSSDKGPRTVILYTSDHGESFREHWQLGHTSSIYDEEIKVPGWIDAPEGTLSAEEKASLVGARNEFVWHYDMAATMLDLMGIWDAPQMRPFRARMIGRPITRPERTMRPVPITNCAWTWECGFRNWGMMQGHMKIEAREWDNEFHCFDLLADPLEQTNLGEQACAPLPDIARRTFGPMPFQDWPGGLDTIYGPAPSPSAPGG